MSNMFYLSKFNQDISNWYIKSVNNLTYIFDDCPCEKPWWVIEDNEKRKIAITNYNLMKQLNNKLNYNINIIQSKKIKI